MNMVSRYLGRELIKYFKIENSKFSQCKKNNNSVSKCVLYNKLILQRINIYMTVNA